jgi:hypothetical protein
MVHGQTSSGGATRGSRGGGGGPDPASLLQSRHPHLTSYGGSSTIGRTWAFCSWLSNPLRQCRSEICKRVLVGPIFCGKADRTKPILLERARTQAILVLHLAHILQNIAAGDPRIWGHVCSPTLDQIRRSILAVHFTRAFLPAQAVSPATVTDMWGLHLPWPACQWWYPRGFLCVWDRGERDAVATCGSAR